MLINSLKGPISSSSYEKNTLKISHQNTFYFLTYAKVRYVIW